jgi:aryl-alcohol dehydrogenase
VRIEAAVWREGSPVPVIETLELEDPRPGEVLVRLVATGVCHTDLRVASRPGGPRPIVLGHEGAGVIERAGEGVLGLEPGQKVLMSYAFCGDCVSCRRHARAYCVQTVPRNFSGLRADGTSPLSKDGRAVFGSFFGQSSFATHAVCAADQVVLAPDDLPLEILAPLGCGVQTGAGAVLNSLKVGAGQSLAVFGAGSVGLSAVMAAKTAGAAQIIAIDPNPSRLTLALELGATRAIDPSRTDPVGAVVEVTGAGADFVLNTTDVPQVYLQGIGCLAPQGTFGFVTRPGGPLEVDLSPILLGGRRIQGVLQGDSEPQGFIPTLVALHRQGRFPLQRLVTTYPFEDIAAAMHASEVGAAIKPVIIFPS